MEVSYIVGVSYIMAVSLIGGGNPEKTTNLSQVTNKFYHT
jgi:hypothetical protein